MSNLKLSIFVVLIMHLAHGQSVIERTDINNIEVDKDFVVINLTTEQIEYSLLDDFLHDDKTTLDVKGITYTSYKEYHIREFYTGREDRLLVYMSPDRIPYYVLLETVVINKPITQVNVKIDK